MLFSLSYLKFGSFQSYASCYVYEASVKKNYVSTFDENIQYEVLRMDIGDLNTNQYVCC